MSAPVKAAAAGVASVGLGAAGIWMMYSRDMPTWTSLKRDDGFNLDAAKYGHKYSRYLVGHAAPGNEPWWKWSFSHRYKSQDIKDVNDGFFSLSDETKLKEACKASYGGTLPTKENKVSVSLGASSKNYAEEHIWRFCSPLYHKPQTIYDLNETNNYKDKKAYGKVVALISVNAKENNSFWYVRNLEFYGAEGFDKVMVDSADVYFAEEQKKKEEGKFIKDLCKGAYELSSAGDTGAQHPTIEQIVKYCSLDFNAAPVV